MCESLNLLALLGIYFLMAEKLIFKTHTREFSEITKQIQKSNPPCPPWLGKAKLSKTSKCLICLIYLCCIIQLLLAQELALWDTRPCTTQEWNLHWSAVVPNYKTSFYNFKYKGKCKSQQKCNSLKYYFKHYYEKVPPAFQLKQ